MGKQIIKVLTGMRRVGKSTLLMQIQNELINSGVKPEQIISINFEMMEYEPINDYQLLNAYIRKRIVNDEKYYVFLDEVQEVKGFEKVINSLNAEEIAEVFITGSNSKLLSGELATYLTGRFYVIEILPLSFKEIFDHDAERSADSPTERSAIHPAVHPADRPTVHRDDSPASNTTVLPAPIYSKEELLKQYINTGGMPGILQFDDDRIKKNYLLDMYQSILFRDIVKRSKIRDVDLLQRFMRYLLHNIGQIFSAGTITKYLKSEGRKLSKETIYNYLEAAKNAYLIHGIPRYNIKGKELLKTNEKYFINDLGLRSLYFDNEQDIGQALENLVYLHLRRQGFEVYVGKIDKQEIDFIAVKGQEKKYMQVSYLLAEPSTIEREFSALEAIDDNFPKLVLSLDRVNRSQNGIIHQNIAEFLLN
ncbi:MAG: ATP-binding protein [Spirochaetales bacterium]|nr:ATP-binding protein [Spirochaetales bacterium]